MKRKHIQLLIVVVCALLTLSSIPMASCNQPPHLGLTPDYIFARPGDGGEIIIHTESHDRPWNIYVCDHDGIILFFIYPGLGII
jgi:hypothetical protein